MAQENASRHLPNVERKDETKRVYSQDLYSDLFNQASVIMVEAPIDKQISSDIVKQLLVASQAFPDRSISIYLNTEHGDALDILPIIDTIKVIKAQGKEVFIVVPGYIAGSAALLAACYDGPVFVAPHAQIKIEPPVFNEARRGWQETDIRIAYEWVERMYATIRDMYAAKRQISADRADAELHRHQYLSADEAIEFGVAEDYIQ